MSNEAPLHRIKIKFEREVNKIFIGREKKLKKDTEEEDEEDEEDEEETVVVAVVVVEEGEEEIERRDKRIGLRDIRRSRGQKCISCFC